MSSPSWDFPSSSANPGLDDDDIDQEQLEREQIEALERELLDQLEREQNGAPHPDLVDALEQDQRAAHLEREQIEALEREQLAQLEQLDAADLESSERSEREELEALEREQLRQLEALVPPDDPYPDAAPRPSPAAAPAARPRPAPAPAAPVAEEWPAIDGEALAAQFLAKANGRQAFADDVRSPQPSTERREMNEPARAARTIVEHRHRNLLEANALLTDARKVLAPIAYRGLSDRTYLRRKIILGIGEAVSLAVAFSAAFDVAPLEGLLLSGAIALAFVVAGDLGGVLRLTSERSRLSAALEDNVVQLDPRYLHVLYHDRQPWLSIVGGVTAAVFALATVSVGVLRAANQGSVGLAAGLGLLTISLAIAAGLSSWQHASIGSEIIDHLQREEEAAARRLKRAAASRVLRRPQILTAVGSDDLEMPSYAPDLDWQVPAAARSAPDEDWQAPIPERRERRPRRAGRAAREKPAKREKSAGGLLGAAAGRAAVFLASRPGKSRSEQKAAKKEQSIDFGEPAGEGPGAMGESAGPISNVTFIPPVVVTKKFGRP